MTNKIEVALLRQLLRYEPDTGKLFWLPRSAMPGVSAGSAKAFNSRFAGREALTSTCGNGYIQGTILGVKVLGHRVIWAVVHGAWPSHEIDHINGNRADNRLQNLREVNRAENCRNLALRSDNKTGYIGIRWAKGAFQASITLNGKPVHLGRFNSIDEAVRVRCAAQAQAGYHPNHGRAS